MTLLRRFAECGLLLGLLSCSCSTDEGRLALPVNADRPTSLERQGDVVIDHNTGLMWAVEFQDFTPDNVNDPRQSVEAAMAYCESLQLAGFSDWRLPTRLELLSIADHTRLRPALDPDLFPGDVYVGGRSPFWTATPHPAENQYFAIGFDDGAVTFDGDVTKPVRARCVRSTEYVPVPDPPFEVYEDVVYDRRTGLTWERRPMDSPFRTADAAMEYCAKLETAGGGWRLPRVKELNTIVDETRAFPAIDPRIFPATRSDWYWTATPYHGFAGYYWAVTFADGASYINEADHAYARCVRP